MAASGWSRRRGCTSSLICTTSPPATAINPCVDRSTPRSVQRLIDLYTGLVQGTTSTSSTTTTTTATPYLDERAALNLEHILEFAMCLISAAPTNADVVQQLNRLHAKLLKPEWAGAAGGYVVSPTTSGKNQMELRSMREYHVRVPGRSLSTVLAEEGGCCADQPSTATATTTHLHLHLHLGVRCIPPLPSSVCTFIAPPPAASAPRAGGGGLLWETARRLYEQFGVTTPAEFDALHPDLYCNIIERPQHFLILKTRYLATHPA